MAASPDTDRDANVPVPRGREGGRVHRLAVTAWAFSTQPMVWLAATTSEPTDIPPVRGRGCPPPRRPTRTPPVLSRAGVRGAASAARVNPRGNVHGGASRSRDDREAEADWCLAHIEGGASSDRSSSAGATRRSSNPSSVYPGPDKETVPADRTLQKGCNCQLNAQSFGPRLSPSSWTVPRTTASHHAACHDRRLAKGRRGAMAPGRR